MNDFEYLKPRNLEKTSVVGKSVPRVDAFEKVTGAAVYTVDIDLPGMLYGKILRSHHPHARILSIDTKKAVELPGVKAVVTSEDTPNIKFSLMANMPDKMALEKDKVRFIGDEIAAVAAINEKIAAKALELIKVNYEELPAVFDPFAAMKPSAPRVHDDVENNVRRHIQLECGDIKKGFSEADVIVEDKFSTQRQAQSARQRRLAASLLDSQHGRAVVVQRLTAEQVDDLAAGGAGRLDDQIADTRLAEVHTDGCEPTGTRPRQRNR